MIGTPDDAIAKIEQLVDHTGGFGTFLLLAHNCAAPDATWRSYELFARWVMPRFQDSLETTVGSRDWCSENRSGIFGPAMGALRARAEARGSSDFSPLWAGQNVGGCREIPAAELTRASTSSSKAK